MNLIRIASTATLLLPVVCHATLGAAPSTDAHQTSRSLRATPSVASVYSIHESETADGVTVREYASPANVVFALTWQGPTRPDMQALLGSYFPGFVAAAHRIARGTGPLIVGDGDLRIESVGHPGAFAGKAWVPRLVPANVDVEALP
ncbi:DUF2844 domain-containing protein [Paraburkholderia diazotrophica]|uniref:DUF2844 domain-containing protein n=1 Tax=Paraburkholderia diazotrophica TaxID=667676 RepID=UPI00317B3913